MYPIFRLLILLTVAMLINLFFVVDSVYCGEDTVNNAATSSKKLEIVRCPVSSGIHIYKPLENINYIGIVDIAAKL